MRLMIQPSSSKMFGASLIVLGLAVAITAILRSPYRTLGPILGLPLMYFGATILGSTGRFARSLQPLVGNIVQVEVWSMPLPATHGASFRVDSITLLGAGLWIYLRSNASGRRTKLKIAQPTELRLRGGHAEIDFAGYVQWASQRVKSPRGKRAPGTVTLSLAASAPGGPA
jgi:hypothetical protein